MRRVSVLVLVAMLACCAASASETQFPPPGPVTDAASAIKIARRIWVGNRDDSQFQWHAVLQDGVWKAKADLIEKPYCNRFAGFGLEIQAATGEVANPFTTKFVC
jgi:hypothetical protein